jgi:hypothetical protein
MSLIGMLHNLLAAAFFLTLLYFAGFLFTRSNPDKPPTPQKIRRNRIYRVCAVVMGLSLALGLTLHYVPAFTPFHPLLWGETLACEAFGVAWFVKGASILKDEEGVR